MAGRCLPQERTPESLVLAFPEYRPSTSPLGTSPPGWFSLVSSQVILRGLSPSDIPVNLVVGSPNSMLIRSESSLVAKAIFCRTEQDLDEDKSICTWPRRTVCKAPTFPGKPYHLAFHEFFNCTDQLGCTRCLRAGGAD